MKNEQKKGWTISIAIVAHNEEKNISNVLGDILRQDTGADTIGEIIVFCDGCTDGTARKAGQTGYGRIKVFEEKIRRGKCSGINKICAEFGGDFLVLFDADVRLEGTKVIKNLLETMEAKKPGLAGGNARPFPPRNFFERAVYSTFFAFDDWRMKINEGRNLFTCNGGCLAMTKELAKKIKIPLGVRNDDTYLYFICKVNKYRYEHAREAVVRYKLPVNLTDYLRQVFRSNPESASLHMEKYFRPMIKKEYYRPTSLYFSGVLRAFLADPAPAAYIILIMLVCRPFYPIMSRRYKLQWWTAKSTK